MVVVDVTVNIRFSSSRPRARWQVSGDKPDRITTSRRCSVWHEMLFGVLTFSFVLASVVCSVALVSMHRRRVRELTEQLAEAHRYEQLAYDAVCEERALRQELQRKCFDAEVRAEFFQRWAFVRSPERADPCHELTLEHFETGEAPWRPTSEDES